MKWVTSLLWVSVLMAVETACASTKQVVPFPDQSKSVADPNKAREVAHDRAQENIIPVEADIEQFWTWFTPGVWTASLEFEAKVKITGDVSIFKNGEMVRGYVLLHTQATTTRAWLNTIEKGMENFEETIKQRLAGQP